MCEEKKIKVIAHMLQQNEENPDTDLLNVIREVTRVEISENV